MRCRPAAIATASRLGHRRPQAAAAHPVSGEREQQAGIGEGRWCARVGCRVERPPPVIGIPPLILSGDQRLLDVLACPRVLKVRRPLRPSTRQRTKKDTASRSDAGVSFPPTVGPGLRRRPMTVHSTALPSNHLRTSSGRNLYTPVASIRRGIIPGAGPRVHHLRTEWWEPPPDGELADADERLVRRRPDRFSVFTKRSIGWVEHFLGVFGHMLRAQPSSSVPMVSPGSARARPR